LSRIEPYLPLSHGIPQVDDRRIVSGIIFVIMNGLRWRDAPAGYGPHKTIYNRFIRWSCLGVFNWIFAELAAKSGKHDRLKIDAFPSTKALLADRGHDADWFRTALEQRGIAACIPSKANRKVPIALDTTLYR
jgi:transposase